MTAKYNFKQYQGSTFNEAIRWESSESVYVPITNIAKSAPCRITAVGHSLPEGWRFRITDVVGMKEINSSLVYYEAKVIDADTVDINKLNSLSYTAYASGGVIEYNKPTSLAGMTARMQLRVNGELVHEMTTENGGIYLDVTNSRIVLNIPAAITATFVFNVALYQLEIIDALGVVSTLAKGNFQLLKEVTK